jgi:superfamily II RNA helicase
MVVLCDIPFVNDESCENHFARFPNFTLSDFQKWAISGIVKNEHVLITAHTGSGKTLPAEFAIQHYVEKGKKIIYTTPIKALSNTKLSEMRRKYPEISFGIITGDVTDNPEADVIIMTTEILRNTLFNKKIKKQVTSNYVQEFEIVTEHNTLPLAFEMDIENDLAAVIFDEVHYINDEDRGSVWEQAILLLPPQVQLIMLSATIDKPEVFASWIEVQKNIQMENVEFCDSCPVSKNVYLIPTNHRVVPLTHYMWITTHESILKKMGGDPMLEKINEVRGKPVIIKTADGKFSDANYHKVKTVSNYLEKNRCMVKRKHILNQLTTYMKRNNHLPAICFVFSRKNVESCAKEITSCLFDDDSTVPATIEDECKKILISKFPNYKEYIDLPEYTELMQILKKGIAIHHAGMLSVLRELVEMLFDKGYIKLLFATETFAVGINVPAKSTIFTSLSKYNGHAMRNLYSHEYTQMAGRAGRRGIDKKGLVWILGNLVDMNSVSECKQILTGSPQTLTSKFKISFQLALHIMAAGGSINNIESFSNTSLITTDINNEISLYDKEYTELQEQLINKKQLLQQVSKTPIEILQQYTEKKALLKVSSNKQRKRILREISSLEDDYRTLTMDIQYYTATKVLDNDIEISKKNKEYTENYISTNTISVGDFLQKHKFIEEDSGDEYKVTELGNIASQLQETNPLALSKIIIDTDYFKSFTPIQIATILSCFTNVNVKDDVKRYNVGGFDTLVDSTTQKLKDLMQMYQDSERAMIYNDCGTDYTFHLDLQVAIKDWCMADSEERCKEIIQTLKNDSGIFLGDFIKSILKISNIVSELEKIAEMVHRVDMLEKVQHITPMIMKYVATNLSLYI